MAGTTTRAGMERGVDPVPRGQGTRRAAKGSAGRLGCESGGAMPIFDHDAENLGDNLGENAGERSGLGRSPWSAQPVIPRTDEEVRLALRQLPRYRVLLFNDDHNSMDHVVIALLRTVPRLSIERAMWVMREAHTNGVAEVIICPRETAEFYREGLERHGLTSTIEPL